MVKLIPAKSRLYGMDAYENAEPFPLWRLILVKFVSEKEKEGVWRSNRGVSVVV